MDKGLGEDHVRGWGLRKGALGVNQVKVADSGGGGGGLLGRWEGASEGMYLEQGNGWGGSLIKAKMCLAMEDCSSLVTKRGGGSPSL